MFVKFVLVQVTSTNYENLQSIEILLAKFRSFFNSLNKIDFLGRFLGPPEVKSINTQKQQEEKNRAKNCDNLIKFCSMGGEREE